MGPSIGPINAGIATKLIVRTSSDFEKARTSVRRPTGTIIAPPNPCSTRHNTSNPAACQNVRAGPANKAGIRAFHSNMTTVLRAATSSGANTRKPKTFIIQKRLTVLLLIIHPLVVRILQLLPQCQDRVTLPG